MKAFKWVYINVILINDFHNLNIDREIFMTAPQVSLMELGKFKLRQHEFHHAENAFLEEVNQHPKNHQAWYYIGYCRKRLYKMEEALDPFKNAVDINDSVPDYLYDLSSTYLALGFTKESRKVAIKLKKMDQNRFSQDQIEKLLSK